MSDEPMLSPDQCFAGSLADATVLTLILPRTSHEETVLVAPQAQGAMAIFLGESHRFSGFECSTATNWKGLLVPDVRIRLDAETLFDPDRAYIPTGALVRHGDQLSVAAAIEDEYAIRRQQLVALQRGLPPSGSGMRGAFRRWQITLGEGEERQVLETIEVEPTDRPPV